MIAYINLVFSAVTLWMAIALWLRIADIHKDISDQLGDFEHKMTDRVNAFKDVFKRSRDKI